MGSAALWRVSLAGVMGPASRPWSQEPLHGAFAKAPSVGGQHAGGPVLHKELQTFTYTIAPTLSDKPTTCYLQAHKMK